MEDVSGETLIFVKIDVAKTPFLRGCLRRNRYFWEHGFGNVYFDPPGKKGCDILYVDVLMESTVLVMSTLVHQEKDVVMSILPSLWKTWVR